ncbi:MAG: prepilin-type N-terminal cleavage/methylation domain-containing protein [Terriglobales bacterium]
MLTGRKKSGGFTIIELMVVISIILILISIAVPIYNQSILRAREAVLRQDLFAMRSAIDQYTMDKSKAPQALQDLIQEGYLREIPKDPFTDSRDTWQVAQEDVLLSIDQNQPGITDVHSGSNRMGTDGTAYNTW